MAAEAVPVPDLLQMRCAGRQHEDIVAREPAFFFEEISEGGIGLLVAVFARNPVSLHVMRAGRERDTFLDPGRVRFRTWLWRSTALEVFLLEGAEIFPIRIDHLDPE